MRNCEKFKTAEERGRAFRKFCHHGCVGCVLSRVSSKLSDCPMFWLDLKAEEDEPLPCPFCGGEVVIGETSYKGQKRLHQAWCKNFKQCDYNGAKKAQL